MSSDNKATHQDAANKPTPTPTPTRAAGKVMNADTYRLAFRRLLRCGYTPAEALDEFDIERLRLALGEELENRGRCAIDDTDSLFSMCGAAWKDQAELRDLGQACDLWGAGWKKVRRHTPARIR